MNDPVDFDASPHAWAAELQTFLLQCDAVYRALGDDDARRRYATLTLGGLFERLEHVPALAGLGQLPTSRDVLDFFDDIDRGRDHAWRSLGPFGGLQKYTKVEERVRTRALIGVEMLLDAATGTRRTKQQAFARVSGLAIDAGYQLSPARVKGLYYEFRAGRFRHSQGVTTFVSNFWRGQAVGTVALCDHGHPVHLCSASGGGRCTDIHAAVENYIGGLFLGV